MLLHTTDLVRSQRVSIFRSEAGLSVSIRTNASSYLRFVTAMVALVSHLSISGCDRNVSGANEEDQEESLGDLTGASNFYLEQDVLRLEVERALDGDQEAADRVYMHSGTVNPQDRETQMFWARIAAENGSVGYMYLYAKMLHAEGGYQRCRRALFWLRRSSELSPEAVEDNVRLSKYIEADSKCQRPR